MLQEERFFKIIEHLKESRTATFSEIAKLLQISEATARKDLSELDKRGVIRLVRGGAVWKQDDLTKEVSEVRDTINREEKQELVEALGDLVLDGQAVALNGGTTTAEAARFLARNYERLTVITNNLTVLNILNEKKDFTFIVPGGIYCEKENTIVGKQAEYDIGQYNMDYAILAINAISLKKGITDFRTEEKGIINAMIKSAQTSVVVADHTKFERIACMNVCPLEQISHIITDSALDNDILLKYKARGVDVIQPKDGGPRANDPVEGGC